jgi:SPRY domain
VASPQLCPYAALLYRTVYTGKRLRCTVDALTPQQQHHFRVRAVHPAATEPSAWSDCATLHSSSSSERSDPPTAVLPPFRFDSAAAGPAIAVAHAVSLSSSGSAASGSAACGSAGTAAAAAHSRDAGAGMCAVYGGRESWSTVLCSAPLVCGVNTWRIHIDATPTAYLFIGVATREADVTTFLGGDKHGWGFIGDRALYHGRARTRAYGERFGSGDVIGVTLDSNRGTLSFSRNGRELGVAFAGMRGELYPAVAFYNQV